MRYRPEIDGLRAAAVIPVIMFHAGFKFLSGGFVGVDVFFVISGYLIASIILSELDEGKFSLVGFYERRARRILPALFVVIAFCVPFAWIWLLPNEMKEFSQSLVAVAVFISNILFWNESGYFDTAAELKPLLHTWSLAVEEQYYIIFPLLMAFVWRWRKYWIVALLLTFGVASLGAAQWLVYAHRSAAFYLPITRIWEILSGVYVAFYFNRQETLPVPGYCNEALSVLGLLLIAFSLVAFDDRTPFPSLYALPPVLGTVFVILFAQNGTTVNRLLGNRFLVGIGLISYSAYLWHQPIFVFTRYIVSLKPNAGLMISLSLFAFGPAYLTWRYVEKPFRNKLLISQKTIFILGPVSLLLLVSLGTLGWIYGGFANRFVLNSAYEGDVGHLEFHKYIAERYYTCTPANIAAEALKRENFIRCMQSKESTDVDVALIGDSHVEHLFIGLAESLPNRNVAFYIKGSAPFISNPEFTNIFRAIITSKSISTVLVGMRWAARLREVPEGSSLERELTETINALQKSGKEVYLLDDVPSFESTPERCKFGIHSFSQSLICSIVKHKVEKDEMSFISTLEHVAQSFHNVPLISLKDFLCDDDTCNMVKNGVLMYRDTQHLNIPGSRYIGRQIVAAHPELVQHSELVQ